MPRIDVVPASNSNALCGRKRISLERVHQFVQGYSTLHPARDQLSVFHTDIAWPNVFSRSFIGVRGHCVVPARFMLHSNGSAEDADVIRVGEPAHECDVSVLYTARPRGISHSPLAAPFFEFLHRIR